MAQTKNRTRPIAAAVPISGTPMRPISTPSAPAVLRVPIGKVNHDCGTPALSMPGMIGLKWTRAAMPEKASAAMARRVTRRYAVNMGTSDKFASPLVGDADGLLDRLGLLEHAKHEMGDVSTGDRVATRHIPAHDGPVLAG